jgi:gas vesicle protein
MKYLAGFVLGALAGAVAALLLAPQSGEELRARLRAGAEKNYDLVQEQTQKGMAQLQAQMDKLSSEVQSTMSKAKGSGKSA